MTASFQLRNEFDSLDLDLSNLGSMVPGGSIPARKLLFKNNGDRFSTGTKLRVVADVEFSNTSGTPLLATSASSSNDPDPGSYEISFIDATHATVNSGPSIATTTDAQGYCTNLIPDARLKLQSPQPGDTCSVIVNEGHLYAKIASDTGSGTGAYGQEVSFGYVHPKQHPAPIATIINDGFVGETDWSYRISGFSEDGYESAASQSVVVSITEPNKSVKLDWEAMPGILGYNVYKELSGTTEKFLDSVTTNSYVDDGTRGVELSHPYTEFSFINARYFWLKVDLPVDISLLDSLKKFKIRAIGTSS